MSTEEQKKTPSKSSPVSKEILDQWDSKHFGIGRQMAQKIRFETAQYLKTKPKPNRPAPFPPLASWEQNIDDLALLKPEQRAGQSESLVKSLQTNLKKLLENKTLSKERVEEEKKVLMAAIKRLSKANKDRAENRKKTQLQKSTEIAKDGERLQLDKFAEGLLQEFTDNKIQAIETSAKVDDSTFKTVTQAMRRVATVQAGLKNGNTSQEDFTQATTALRQAAQSYLDSHKNPKTDDGKERVKQAAAAVQKIDRIWRVIIAMNAEIKKICEKVAKMSPEESGLPMIDTLEGLLKSTYLGSENKTQIEKLIDNIRKQQQTIYDNTLKENGLVNPNGKQLAESLLSVHGTCKPPKSKGNSDSFFINGVDGKPKFILKPVNGESRFSDAWPDGGGAPRELLLSQFSDGIGKSIGLDFGVPKTIAVKLEDESFKQGTKSKDTTRVGALQETVKVGDPPDARGFLEKLPTEELKARLESINEEDAENIAIMDFITLNGDRHVENMLLRDPPSDKPGQTRLCPIDAGQALPTPEAFLRGSASMSSLPYDESNPNLEVEANFLMQLPMAGRKFSKKQLEALDKLDPEGMIEKMKSDNAELAKQHPEMGGKVSDESFDLAKKSAYFLKEAAKELTIHEISQVYASGFTEIVQATNKTELDKAIREAIQSVKELAQLGGKKKLGTLYVTATNPPLTHKEQIAILKQAGDSRDDALVAYANTLIKKLDGIEAYIADSDGNDKENVEQMKQLKINSTKDITGKFMNDVQDFISYRSLGGDPMYKACLAGNDAVYQKMVAKSVRSKSQSIQLNPIKEFLRIGGYPRLKQLMGNDYNAIASDDFSKHHEMLEDLVASAG